MEVLNKIWKFLRSMRFGIGLLIVIALLSVVGTVIPQGKSPDWYAAAYPRFHSLFLTLGFHHLYQSWYYVALLALLSLNLTLCTVTRLRFLLRTGKEEAVHAARLPVMQQLSPQQTDAVRRYLRERHCIEREIEGVSMFSKFRFGRYGSFLTHLGILLTVLLGAAALYLPQVQDLSCVPGESIALDDGTQIFVQDFSIEDSAGKLDYASNIRVTLPNGRESDFKRISVNTPMSFGPYKIYQQQYGVAGAITVHDGETDTEDTFTLTEEVLLTKDSVSGVWYHGVGESTVDENGELALTAYRPESDQSPIYVLEVMENGGRQQKYALPGSELEVGDLTFYVEDPVLYPGLRIKHTPHAVNALLIAAFAVMTIGLYITFFMQPVLVKLTDEGYTVAGTKPEGMRVELEQLLEEEASGAPGKEKR